jgi:hypothetical protein
MINAVASIFDFINTRINSDLSGITNPNIIAHLTVPGEAPTFPNCLNVIIYDHISIGKHNPPWRKMIGSLELYIEKLDSSAPEIAEANALKAIHLITKFMSVQTCQKKDFSVNPQVYLGSNIQWRDSYPLDWRSSFLRSDRYVLKKCSFTARYFEERLN